MELEAEVFAPEECHKILWIQVENPLVSICSRESPERSLHFFPSKCVTLFFSLVIAHILIRSK